jgi:two-component system C4-dicarboxylate transport response regulator DctD
MPRRLLVVDDDQATRSGLCQLLQAAGFTCAEADSYQAAHDTLHANPPDLLITDIRLGGYNGIQLVLGRPPGVSAIVITGHPDTVLESEAERSGAKYLQKPIAPRRLLELIDEMLGVDVSDRSHRA